MTTNTDYDPRLPLKYDYFGNTDDILQYIDAHNLRDFLLCFYDNVLLSGYDVWHITVELDTTLKLTIYTGATFQDSDLVSLWDRLVPFEIQLHISLISTRD